MGPREILRQSLADYKSNPVLLIPPLVNFAVPYLTAPYAVSGSEPSIGGVVSALRYLLLVLIVWFAVIIGQASMTGKVVSTGRTGIRDWSAGVRRHFFRVLGIGLVFAGIIVLLAVAGVFVLIFTLLSSLASSGAMTPSAIRAATEQSLSGEWMRSFTLSLALVVVVAEAFFLAWLAPAVLDDKGVFASVGLGVKAVRRNLKAFAVFVILFAVVSAVTLFVALYLSSMINICLAQFCLGASVVSGLVSALFSPLWFLIPFRIYDESGVGQMVATQVPPTVTDMKFCHSCGTRIQSSAKYCANCGAAQVLAGKKETTGRPATRPWVILLVFAGTFLFFAFVAVLAELGLPAYPGFVPSYWVGEFMLIVPPILFLRLKKFDVKKALGLERPRLSSVLLGSLAGLALVPVVAAIYAITEMAIGPMPPQLAQELMRWFPQNWIQLVPWLGGAALVPGIAEEVLMRGFVQNGLQKTWSRSKALFAASILFGVIHLSPWNVPYAIAFGFLAGYLFVVTGSLYTTMALHVTVNSVSTVLGFLQVNPSTDVLWIVSLPAVSALLLMIIALERKRAETRMARTTVSNNY